MERHYGANPAQTDAFYPSAAQSCLARRTKSENLAVESWISYVVTWAQKVQAFAHHHHGGGYRRAFSKVRAAARPLGVKTRPPQRPRVRYGIDVGPGLPDLPRFPYEGRAEGSGQGSHLFLGD